MIFQGPGPHAGLSAITDPQTYLMLTLH